MARPTGEISQAILAAAADKPGTVKDLAKRAKVGRIYATYTASRLVKRGELVLASERRPYILAVKAKIEQSAMDALQAWAFKGELVGEDTRD